MARLVPAVAWEGTEKAMEQHEKPISAAPTAAEIEILAARAGLHLNPGQMADLAIAWRYAVQAAALVPRVIRFADDFAFAFHLAPPAHGKPAKSSTSARRAKRGSAKRGGGGH